MTLPLGNRETASASSRRGQVDNELIEDLDEGFDEDFEDDFDDDFDEDFEEEDSEPDSMNKWEHDDNFQWGG